MLRRKGLSGLNDYNSIINQASQTYGVDSGLIKAVIQAESNGNPNAVSSVGAQGLMQLMPSTASSLGVTNSFDPSQNIFGATKYLSQLISQYDGDIETALAAYNFGPGNIASGKEIPTSTLQYVGNILRNSGIAVSNQVSNLFNSSSDIEISNSNVNFSSSINWLEVVGLGVLGFILARKFL